MERIGQLSILRRYPVKSMAGEDLQEARVSFAGLIGDRVFAFIDNRNRSNFPWMTARQGRELILFQAAFSGSAEDRGRKSGPGQLRGRGEHP